MPDKFLDADQVEGKYMEVIVISKDGQEYIYWVGLEKLPDGEDEYDWSIETAIKFHNSKNLSPYVSEEDAEAGEPFSRFESEFVYIK